MRSPRDSFWPGAFSTICEGRKSTGPGHKVIEPIGRWLGFICVLLIFKPFSSAAASTANPGNEVIIVYNKRMAESKELAMYYAGKRHVPDNQIFGFALPTIENMTRDEFRDSLQKPLAAEFEKRKLWHVVVTNAPGSTNKSESPKPRVVESTIRYAVLMYGVPLRILSDPTLKEEASEKIKPELRRNEAAVDSELALLPVMQQKLPLAGPLRNPLFTETNRAWFRPERGVLMVTRLDGPSVAVARGLVDKSLEAERDGLWGRTYFDLRNAQDPTYKTGDDMIRSAAEICRHLGFEAVVDENIGTFPAGFPMSHIAFYAGWYTEHVSGPFALPNVEFMPGAFAYHLHSFSANTLRSSEKQWVGPLLAKGVTITLGTIDEPYLAGTPDIAVFVARFMLNGFSFGEAAYACQPVLSWQTTCVGDPLYQPFDRNLDQVAKELIEKKSKVAEWCYLRLVDLNQANGRTVGSLISFLEQLPHTTNSAILTEKLGDLYKAQGKPSSAVHAWEEALKLDPSPQQRMRLRLTLGERLETLSREEEAFENYESLLKESPDYADKAGIYKMLLSLARKLNKKAEAEKYEAELKK